MANTNTTKFIETLDVPSLEFLSRNFERWVLDFSPVDPETLAEMYDRVYYYQRESESDLGEGNIGTQVFLGWGPNCEVVMEMTTYTLN